MPDMTVERTCINGYSDTCQMLAFPIRKVGLFSHLSTSLALIYLILICFQAQRYKQKLSEMENGKYLPNWSSCCYRLVFKNEKTIMIHEVKMTVEVRLI